MSRKVRKFIPMLGIVALLFMMLTPLSAAAARRPGPPPPPDPEPVEITSICQERRGPGVANWKPNGECNHVYQAIVFDGVTAYDFCFLSSGQLYQPGVWGCPVGATPVTLTGDGSVDVSIGAYGIIFAPGYPGGPGVI